MKKIILLISLIEYSAILFSKEVHVVPVYQERLTNKWCALFAHDAGGLWNMFKQEFDSNDNVFECAARALQEQTNGTYKFDSKDLQHQPSLTFNNGKLVVCCIPVKHMTLPMLNKKMASSLDQNVIKDKYLWLPVDDILARTTVVKTARNMTMRYKFDGITRAVFKQHWESYFQPRLNAQVNKQNALALLKKGKPVKMASISAPIPRPKNRVSIEKPKKRVAQVKPSIKVATKQAHKTRWNRTVS